jgi:polar amino acid transport system permease protein
VKVALDFGELLPYTGVFARGLLLTVELALVASALGVTLGILGALARGAANPLARFAGASYVELCRNTPFLVQLFFIFFGLPALGVKLTAEFAAFLALTLNLGAYATEIVRAGLESISRGQRMAAASLGLTSAQALLHVVLKPAFANVWPGLVSQLVLIMLGSAVVSQVAAEDLSYAANFVQSRNFRAFECYLAATLLYLLLAVAMRQSLLMLGRRLFVWRNVGR